MGELNDYGFLTQFDVTWQEARDRVKRLSQEFGIKHFQFYDAMERYELPIDPARKAWRNPKGSIIKRKTISC